MLKLLSSTNTEEVFAAEVVPAILSPRNAGRAKASTIKRIINTRKANSNHCLIFIFLILFFCNSFKNASVLNSIFFSLRRFSRWIKTGIEAASSPIKTAGLRNVIYSNKTPFSLLENNNNDLRILYFFEV